MMNSYYQTISGLDFSLFSPRSGRRLTKFAILLNEPQAENDEDVSKEPSALAAELLPELLERDDGEDLVQIIGGILESKIKAHALSEEVAFLRPDKIISENSPTLVPVMYRIAADDFAQTNFSTFKIIECRNATKLISDWKPTLPDKLISAGHQVVVVQLEKSFVPYNDFGYAILRQLDCVWKNRLPRSFFFPDDVCKVETTSERDLCVVTPSMPDGDLEINKKMGLLNYEVLMMIKSSCMSAMKNYLIKRDLRVGKFSDTLDGVSALRDLYRKLQQRLRTGEAIELRSSALADIKKLVKQSLAGADALPAQTWSEYRTQMGLDIPASKSSSTTSIISVDVNTFPNEVGMLDSGNEEDEGDASSNSRRNRAGCSPSVTTSSSGFDVDDGRDCQVDSSPLNNKGIVVESGTKEEQECGSARSSSPHLHLHSQQQHPAAKDSQEDDSDEEGFKLEDFTAFRDSLENRQREKKDKMANAGIDDDEEDYDETEFSAEYIIKMLQVPDFTEE